MHQFANPLSEHLATEAASAVAAAEALTNTRAAALNRAIALGRRIYLGFSEEERAELHRRCRKPRSLRQLAKLEQISLSSLWRALSIYLLAERHPEITSYSHVGVCHASTVLRAVQERQLYFLRKAEQGKWSSRRLHRALQLELHANGAGDEAPVG